MNWSRLRSDHIAQDCWRGPPTGQLKKNAHIISQSLSGGGRGQSSEGPTVCCYHRCFCILLSVLVDLPCESCPCRCRVVSHGFGFLTLTMVLETAAATAATTAIMMQEWQPRGGKQQRLLLACLLPCLAFPCRPCLALPCVPLLSCCYNMGTVVLQLQLQSNYSSKF